MKKSLTMLFSLLLLIGLALPTLAAGEAEYTLSYDEKLWKEENGKFFYDTGNEGELFGETTSSWMEMNIEDDGTLNFMNMLRFEKI